MDVPSKWIHYVELNRERTAAIVANNQGVYDIARQTFAAMRFTPYVENGVPVQVVSRVSLPFKTTRPPGVETFESAQSYFERGRHVGFPAAGIGTPYFLHAATAAITSSSSRGTTKPIGTWR